MTSASRPSPDLHPAAAAAAERGRETKERLLDAAEQLFAARGIERTSLRAVTQAAGASVSAANYHFGSKEELLRATLLRRLAPLNARRLELLDAEEADAAVPDVEVILTAFLQPVFERHASDPGSIAQTRWIAGGMHAGPPELMDPLKVEIFAPVLRRFVAALARALPDAPADALERGFQFAVAVMIHVSAGGLESGPRALPGPAAGASDEPAAADPTVFRHMVAFLAAGLRASAGATR